MTSRPQVMPENRFPAFVRNGRGRRSDDDNNKIDQVVQNNAIELIPSMLNHQQCQQSRQSKCRNTEDLADTDIGTDTGTVRTEYFWCTSS